MTDEPNLRCGNCMQPYSLHIPRREAEPICRTGGVYRAATGEELDAGFRAAFPDGPKPIATFDINKPGDLERARAVLSPEALNGFFGPGGGGVDAFVAAMEAS